AHAGSVAAEPERHGWVHHAVLIVAEAALHRGQAGEALEWLETVEWDDTPSNEFWTPAASVSLRAWALAAMAPGAEARANRAGRAIEAAVESAAAIRDARLLAIARAQLAHAALAAGDTHTARALYTLARPTLLACGSAGRLRLLELHPGLRPPDETAGPLSDR